MSRGVVARMVVAYLRTKPPGHLATNGELAEACGRPASGLGQHLDSAVRAQILVKTVLNHGRTVLWSLGPNAVALAAVKVPNAHASAIPSVFAYAASMVAAPFSTSLSTDGRLRIERKGVLVAELSNDERLQLIETARNGVVPQGA